MASVTRFGSFWNFLGTNFLAKVAQISIYLLGNFKSVAIKIKTDAATFGQLLEKIGLLFIPSSGHTGYGKNALNLCQMLESLYL